MDPEQLPELCRQYRDMKDKMLKLEKSLKPLKEEIIEGLQMLRATKEEPYGVPGIKAREVTRDCQYCGLHHNYSEATAPLSAYLSPVTRESISVKEATFPGGEHSLTAKQEKLFLKYNTSLTLHVEEEHE